MPTTTAKRPKGLAFTKEEIRQAKAWHKEGMKYWEIADRLGVAPSTLSAHKILPNARYGPRRTFDWDEAQRLYNKGITVSAIAKHFDVTTCAVNRAVSAPQREKIDQNARRQMKRIRKERGSGVYGGPCYLCNRECSLKTLICAPCQKAWRRGQDELLKELVR